jgi:hypothetical protein
MDAVLALPIIVAAAALLLVGRVSGLFGLLLLLVQGVMWFLVGGGLIANTNIPERIAWTGIAVPFIISASAWRLVNRKWRWRVNPASSDVGRLRNHRRICIFSAIGFVFLHLVVSNLLRRASLASEGIIAASEATNIATEALRFAVDHGGVYPESLADLPRAHHVEGYWSGTNQIYDPNVQGLDDKTMADEVHFEYFGKGLTANSPPDVVVLASKQDFQDGARVLTTIDSQTVWVGPNGFVKIQHFLTQHVPRSQWKD